MSKTVDERVVSMQFDNKNFEKNVSTSMSTLDKLKQKLNLTGASKGLENISAAANKVDFSKMEYAATSAGFQVQDIWLKTASILEYQVAGRIINTAKRITSALTLDPVKTGFQEYETQINSTQTILANTASKGSTIDDVNRALEELNAYADKTIYNFTEMTRNIGTFTAAGIELDTATNAIQGIANLAAVSGSTSQQASTAMYQLSQALASGTVKLMDWNSVVNAGMGGEMFQNALKETSRLLGTGADQAIETAGSFRESLRDGWLTAEVLTETLKKFTTTGANEYIAEYTGLTKEAVEAETKKIASAKDTAKAIDEVAEALAKSSGKSKEEIKQALTFAQTAEDAATKVKTFTQLWDVLKESAQSGWAQSWKIIVGDFEEAKALITPLADFLTGILNDMSEARNALLESALGRGFSSFKDGLTDLLTPAKSVADSLKTVTDAVKEYEVVVNDIISGKWGNGQDRWDKLAEAGYDWAHAQNLVNEKLGCSVRHATDYTEAQDKANKSQKKGAETATELADKDAKLIDELANLSEAQLREKGYSDAQIASFMELKSAADKLGLSVYDLITNIDEINGRWLLINSFKNIGRGLIDTFKAIKAAWEDVFPPKSLEERSEALFNLIAAFHRVTAPLKLIDDETGKFTETGDNLVRTLKGIFAIVGLVTDVLGGGLKIAFKVITTVLKYFNLDILDVTAAIGDAIVGFREWLHSLFDISGILDIIVPALKNGVEAVVSWVKNVKEGIEAFMALPEIQAALKRFNKALDKLVKGIGPAFAKKAQAIKEFFNSFTNIPQVQNAIEKFSAALDKLRSIDIGGSIKKMIDSFLELPLVQKILTRFGATLDEFGTVDLSGVGKNIVDGLSGGIKDAVKNAVVTIIDLGTALIEGICKVLDINSPSKVFMAIGGFIIAGLLLGLNDGTSSVPDVFQNIVDKCAAIFQKVDWGKLFAVGAAVGVIVMLKKIGDALSVLAAPLEGLGDLFQNASEVLDAFKSSLKSFATSLKAKALKDIALALLILVGAIAILTFLDPVKVAGAVVAISILMGGLVALLNGLEKLGVKGTETLAKFVVLIWTIAGAMLILSIVGKIISSMDWDEMAQAGVGLSALIGVVAALMLISKIGNAKKIGSMLTSIAGAMLILAIIAKAIGGMEWDELKRAGAGMAGLVAVVALLMTISKIGNHKKIGSMLMSIAGAMLILVFVAKSIAKMEWADMGKAAVGILGLVGIISLLMLISKIGNAKKIGSMLMGIAGAILILTIVAKMIARMEWEDMGKAFVGIMGLVGVIALLTLISKLGNAKKIGSMLMKIAGAMLILAIVMKILGSMHWYDMAKALVGIVALGGIIAGLVAITRLAGGKRLKQVSTMLLAMSVAIGILAVVATLLGFIPIENLAKGIVAVGLLAGMMALMVHSTKGMSDSWMPIVVMAAAIAGLAVAMIVLTHFLTPEELLAATASLSLLMGTFALLVKASGSAAKAIPAVGTMILAVGLLAGLLMLLTFLPNTDALIPAAVSLSLLMTALTASLFIISKAGPTVISAIGPAALMGLVVAELAIVLGILSSFAKVESLLPTSIALSILLLALSAACLILVPVGKSGAAAIKGAGVLAAVIVILGLVAAAIGELMSYIPPEKIEEWKTGIKNFMDLISTLAYGLGEAIGSLVGGFLDGALSGLPEIGKHLSGFMTNAQGFIDGAKTVDQSVLAGAAILSAAVIMMSGAELLNGVASFITGGATLADLGTDLSNFMTNASGFLTGIKQVDPSIMEGVKALAETILILTGANLIQGIASFITGEASLGDFGTQMAELGTQLNKFVTNLGEFDENKKKTVEYAAEAIKAMALAANEIPNEGGWAAKLFGDNSIATFGAKLPQLGINLNRFVTNLGTFTKDQVKSIGSACDAIKALATAADDIPNEGGMWASIFGDNSISTFGGQLPDLGTHLNSFVTNLGTFSDDQVDTVTCAGNAITALANAAGNIDGQAEWAKKLFGDNSLATFGTQLADLGTSIKAFTDNLGTFGEDKVATVESAVKAIVALTDLSNADLSGAKKNMGGFGEKLSGLGTDISEFCTNMPAVETLNSAVTNIKSVLSMINDIAAANTTALTNFTSSLKKVGTNGVDTFVKAFAGSSAKEKVKKAAQELMKKVVEGVKSKESTIETAFKTVASKGIDGIKEKYDGFYSAGSYLVDGFAAGISENSYKAAAKAAAMAAAAEAAAREELDINSPSKVFRSLGYSVPEGFAMGIDRLAGMAKDSSTAMANTAIDGVKKSISKISDFMNGDIDAQPTIRPVLDLSDVRSGAGEIGSMLSAGSSVGVLANVNGISSMMDQRIQNGSNAEVVSAIDKLRRDLGKVGNTSYNFGNITYDDGSAIADAVGSLVRAAIRERRV